MMYSSGGIVRAVQAVVDLNYVGAGLAMGLVAIYFKDKDKRKVFVFPSEQNQDAVQYRDLSGQCFRVVQEPVPCETVTRHKSLIMQVVPQP